MTSEEKVKALDGMFMSAAWREIIKPGAQAVIKANIEMWLNASRRPANEKATTEEELKCRVLAMRWLLGWESLRDRLVEQLEANREVQNSMTFSEGGSPYA